MRGRRVGSVDARGEERGCREDQRAGEQRSELRKGVAVNGTASIIVDHDIAACADVARRCAKSAIDRCAK